MEFEHREAVMVTVIIYCLIFGTLGLGIAIENTNLPACKSDKDQVVAPKSLWFGPYLKEEEPMK